MRRALLAVALAALVPASALAWGGPPDWLKELAKAPLPSPLPPKTHAIWLLDETTMTVTDSGQITETRRMAGRILDNDGRHLAVLTIPFDSDTKITSLHGWTIGPHGEEFSSSDRDTVEVAAVDGELYADFKFKGLRMPVAEPGTVFAWEYERRERPQSLQDSWEFQHDVPVRTARYTVVLPATWTHEERWFNAAPAAPQTNGNGATWQLTGIAAVKDEPRRPPYRAVAGRMAINFIPPQAQLSGKSHRSWDDVGRWYAALTSDRRMPSPEIQAKANALVTGKKTTLEKIAALAAFAQREVRYVAIEIGVGALQPHPAPSILTSRFGDCKDKVTLLAAMLKSIGVDSYYVLASTDRGVVDPKFASVAGFNHVVIAIKLPEAAEVPALIKGNLLLFDPTSASTPFGTLPPYLQDNDLLLVTDGGGELIHVAPHAPSLNRLQIAAKLTLDPDGTLHGDVYETRAGWLAAGFREGMETMSEAQRKQWFEQRLARYLAQYQLTGLTFENLQDLGKDLLVHYKLTAPAYAKNAGGLLLVRPRVLGSKAEGVLDLSERMYAYESDGPSLETDEIDIALPPGVAADEIPEPLTVSNKVASYRSETKLENQTLRYRRQYRIDTFVVPRADLPELNGLFTKIAADERASAVLKGK
ncbi:MAG TPA: DUF3857 and transglutaminase domain-containing protein [Thermoanaerobaculia bacterium]|nr:DUF3857 and transglutaminase domain-containing protein [Thermoanaerobaculia bacterium]